VTLEHDEQRAREVAARLSAQLGESWTVEGETSVPPRLHFSFTHPLTSESFVSVDPTADSYDPSFERVLSRPEFGVIAKAPDDLPHQALLRDLRVSARVEKWPASVLPQAALVLHTHGIITSGEAQWLKAAGPCWPTAEELASLGVSLPNADPGDPERPERA
jgi:hypothetical protein